MNGPAQDRFGSVEALIRGTGVEHRSEEFTDDPAVWVIFHGADGSEKEGTGR